MDTILLPEVGFQMPSAKAHTADYAATRTASTGGTPQRDDAERDDTGAARERTAIARTSDAASDEEEEEQEAPHLRHHHQPLTPFVRCCTAAPTSWSASFRRTTADPLPVAVAGDNGGDESDASPGSRSRTSVDSMELVKLVVLGAPAVGKSSIIQQFVWNEFSEEYTPTEKKETYYPSVIINDHLYELKIIDVPVIPYFPVSSLYEWTDFRFYGLRSATAYVLVYDLHAPDTFQYIRTLRDQIFESRDMHNVPLIVVGNKHDACSARDRRDIVTLVKKQWKCSYIECSAKYNWHIVTMFKELMKTIDYIDYGQKAHSTGPGLHGLSGAMQRNKCVIL